MFGWLAQSNVRPLVQLYAMRSSSITTDTKRRLFANFAKANSEPCITRVLHFYHFPAAIFVRDSVFHRPLLQFEELITLIISFF